MSQADDRRLEPATGAGAVGADQAERCHHPRPIGLGLIGANDQHRRAWSHQLTVQEVKIPAMPGRDPGQQEGGLPDLRQ